MMLERMFSPKMPLPVGLETLKHLKRINKDLHLRNKKRDDKK
jgi:hypothetical protein